MAHEVVVLKELPHVCDLPDQSTLYTWHDDYKAYPEGTIIACSDCGKYYYLTLWTEEISNETHGIWNPVRWYHWRKRREIAGR